MAFRIAPAGRILDASGIGEKTNTGRQPVIRLTLPVLPITNTGSWLVVGMLRSE